MQQSFADKPRLAIPHGQPSGKHLRRRHGLSLRDRWLAAGRVGIPIATATRIVRVADTGFEPGDDFCALWHLFDLLPEGAAGWQPEVRLSLTTQRWSGPGQSRMPDSACACGGRMERVEEQELVLRRTRRAQRATVGTRSDFRSTPDRSHP